MRSIARDSSKKKPDHAGAFSTNRTPPDPGLGIPNSWLLTFGFALAGLGMMLAYSPLADRLASRWFVKPPTLEAFRGIQQSGRKLIAGILAAWVLGGILEELIARGIVLGSIWAV